MKLILNQLSNKQLINERAARQVEAKIVDRISRILSPQDIVTLNEMLDSENPELENYLKSKCPDFDKIVDEEVDRANQDKT